MKLLCFSDLHRDREAAENLVRMADQADCLIGAGDFATKRAGLADTLDILKTISKPAVLVPGNGESFDELEEAAEAWTSARVLHGSGCQIEGVDFWGVGGGIPVTPFGAWSYDFDEDSAEELLAGCPKGGVLVVHSPPIDTVDHDTNGQIRGSKAVRATVTAMEPKLVVCGHIHGDWKKQQSIGETRILNAGPSGVMMEL